MTVPPDDIRATRPAVPEPANDPLVPKPDRLKRVPAAREVRDRIRQQASRIASELDKTRRLDKYELETRSRLILEELSEPEDYLGWTMVALASAFWRDQVAATPYQRRLLLLPHCLRDAKSCPAHYNELGLLCKGCGACRLHDLRDRAERLGYSVLIAEGSPVVMQIILSGHADALIGVSCLDVLERSLEKILLAGIPCMAVPLFESTCRNTKTDEDWVEEMIDTPYGPAKARTETYVHLLRAAKRMFQPEELEWLAPRIRGGPWLTPTDGAEPAALDPLASTEAIAYDFLLKGGKRARPFVTLAAYDAMTGAAATGAGGAEAATQIPEAVRRIALAVEVFHKASLVHDDIEDDDSYRYGHRALHRKFGTAVAINVGDYLVGLGYRLVAEQRNRLDAQIVADILAQLAEAHTRLTEGQGAELAWCHAPEKSLAPLDAIKIYALKTAPAFEATLYAGIRLAGPVQHYRQPIARYARHLGVAFQILNDLDDWQPKDENKRSAGGDVLHGHPTVLLALALKNLDGRDRDELLTLLGDPAAGTEALSRVDCLYQQAGVYEAARALVDKHHQRTRELADGLRPDALRHLLHYLADNLLE
ncbi:MAG: polyprenyl synthetase family protein [Pirellulales bacterium]|nr:polyprenyl synthetase family protein [Pirellulales bacterium]